MKKLITILTLFMCSSTSLASLLSLELFDVYDREAKGSVSLVVQDGRADFNFELYEHLLPYDSFRVHAMFNTNPVDFRCGGARCKGPAPDTGVIIDDSKLTFQFDDDTYLQSQFDAPNLYDWIVFGNPGFNFSFSILGLPEAATVKEFSMYHDISRVAHSLSGEFAIQLVDNNSGMNHYLASNKQRLTVPEPSSIIMLSLALLFFYFKASRAQHFNSGMQLQLRNDSASRNY